MLKYLIMVLFYMALFFSVYTKCYAESSYVYCANEKGGWKWLFDDSNIFLTTTGYWRMIWLSDEFYIRYFELSDGKKEFVRLKKLCAKNYGNEYNIVQPAIWQVNHWWPFLVENSFIANGIFSIYRIPNKMNFPFMSQVKMITLKNIYPLDDPKHDFLTFGDLKLMCLRSTSNCW